MTTERDCHDENIKSKLSGLGTIVRSVLWKRRGFDLYLWVDLRLFCDGGGIRKYRGGRHVGLRLLLCGLLHLRLRDGRIQKIAPPQTFLGRVYETIRTSYLIGPLAVYSYFRVAQGPMGERIGTWYQAALAGLQSQLTWINAVGAAPFCHVALAFIIGAVVGLLDYPNGFGGEEAG